MNRIPRLCETDGCERKHYAKGVCEREYKRALRATNLKFRESERKRKRTYYFANKEALREIRRGYFRT